MWSSMREVKNFRFKSFLENCGVYAYRVIILLARFLINFMQRSQFLFFRKEMVTTFFFLLLFCFSGSAAPSLATQEIRIPLGLCWGDSIQKIEEMAKPGGFSITQRDEKGDKTMITVHGLIGTALEENIFTFFKNQLIEIEYRYGDKNWKGQNYQDFFDSFRRMYDKKYGIGVQLINNAKKSDLNGVSTSITGYQWSSSSCVLELFYYIAEQSDQHAYRLISLHYKAP